MQETQVVNRAKVNPLHMFNFYNYTQEDKEVVQSVFFNIISLITSRPNIHWLSVKGGLVLESPQVEITYYEGKEKKKEEIPYIHSNENLMKSFNLLDQISTVTNEFIDEGERYSLMRHGSEKYFEFVVFDRHFMEQDTLLEAGFVTSDLLDYLRNAVLEDKNIVIAGTMHTGKTTLIELLTNMLQDHLLLVFSNRKEIRTKKNTLVRIRYDEMFKGGEFNNQLERLERMKPDYTIYEEPPFGLMENPIEPYIRSCYKYLETLEKNPSETGFRDTADIYIETEHIGDGKYRILKVKERSPLTGEFESYFTYNPENDTLEEDKL